MKYVGSKNRIAKELAPIIQSYITEETVGYLEPFVGGANMIDKILHTNRVGCDIEPMVISLLNIAKDNVEWFDTLTETPTREHYYKVRDNPENFTIEYRASILYFASYNARINGGCYGATANTLIGKSRNYFEEAKKNLIKQAPKLTDIKFKNLDFKKLDTDMSGFVIYCDIPYRDSHYGGKVYNEDGFDYDFFYDWCVRLSKKNIVLISEYYMPEDRFECVWSKEHKTSLDKNDNKKTRIEKLFTVRKDV